MGNGGSLNWNFYSFLSWHPKHFHLKRCLKFLDGKIFNVWFSLWKVLGVVNLKYHETEQCVWNRCCRWGSPLGIGKNPSVSCLSKKASLHLSLNLLFVFLIYLSFLHITLFVFWPSSSSGSQTLLSGGFPVESIHGPHWKLLGWMLHHNSG